jgi:hypothetical protein
MRKGKYNKNGMSDKIHRIRPYFAVFQCVRVVLEVKINWWLRVLYTNYQYIVNLFKIAPPIKYSILQMFFLFFYR